MTMRASKKARLKKKGWKFGNADEFLNLSPEESAYIELKLKLGDHLRHARKRSRLSQTALARRLSSSQSRVAKMESGDPSVSVDLLIRSLLALGATNCELAEVIGSGDDT